MFFEHIYYTFKENIGGGCYNEFKDKGFFISFLTLITHAHRYDAPMIRESCSNYKPRWRPKPKERRSKCSNNAPRKTQKENSMYPLPPQILVLLLLFIFHLLLTWVLNPVEEPLNQIPLLHLALLASLFLDQDDPSLVIQVSHRPRPSFLPS